MTTKLYFGVITIAVIAALAISLNGFTNHAFADKSDAQHGINIADNNVHNHTPGGEGGHQDTVFHNGLCKAGISTDVVTC